MLHFRLHAGFEDYACFYRCREGTQQRVMVTKTLRDIKMTQILASYTAGKGIKGAWRL